MGVAKHIWERFWPLFSLPSALGTKGKTDVQRGDPAGYTKASPIRKIGFLHTQPCRILFKDIKGIPVIKNVMIPNHYVKNKQVRLSHSMWLMGLVFA